MMNLDSITLQSFLSLAETGSFTKTAEHVGRTQSAVSQQMAKLEHMLGVTLLDRSNKSLGLTPEGEIFLTYARQIFALHCEVRDRFKEPDLAGNLSFGLPEDFASVFLSDVLVDFSRLHPRILLNIECDLTMNLYERFKRKEFDLVLVKMTRPEDFPNGHEIWSEPLQWVGGSPFVEQSQPVPLVLSPVPCVYRARALQALQEAGISWRLVFSSPSYASTIAAVRAGMGVTVLPKTMIPENLQQHRLRLPQLDDLHVSLLKHQSGNPVIDSLEAFVTRKAMVHKR